MDFLLQYLDSIYPLSLGLKDYLFSNVHTKSLAKKEFLLKAGQISKQVCFIQQGLLRCYHLRGEKEVSRWFMREGDVIFSISSFYEQKPGFEYIQALENCNLYYLTFDQLEFIYNNFMEFNYVGRVLTIKYHQLWDEQLYSLQMQSAEERYKWLLENHADLPLRVPAKHIASWLDITEVTLSKIKRKALEKVSPGSKKLSFFNSKGRNDS